MDYEKMFVYLISILFTINILITFFALALPTENNLIPPSMTFSTYTQEDAVADLNLSTEQTGAIATSDATQGDTFNIRNVFVVWNVFTKILNNTFLGYYQLAIFFADSLETDSAGAIHILFGGIGALFSIIMIIGFMLLVRSVIFRV